MGGPRSMGGGPDDHVDAGNTPATSPPTHSTLRQDFGSGNDLDARRARMSEDNISERILREERQSNFPRVATQGRQGQSSGVAGSSSDSYREVSLRLESGRTSEGATEILRETQQTISEQAQPRRVRLRRKTRVDNMDNVYGSDVSVSLGTASASTFFPRGGEG